MARTAASPLPRIPRVPTTGGAIAGAQTKGARGYKAAAFSVEALIAAVSQIGGMIADEIARNFRGEPLRGEVRRKQLSMPA